MNNLLIVGIITGGVALLFCIISTAIPYWWSSDHFNFGLFRACIEIRSTTTCAGSTDVPDWLGAVRAMMILSILALGAGLLSAILFCFVMKDKQILAIVSAIMCFVGGGLALVGVIIFGAEVPDGVYDVFYGKGSLHASFGLAIIAFLVAIVTGVLIIMAKGRNA